MALRWRLVAGLALAALAAGGYLYWQAQARPSVRLVTPQRGPAIDAIYATGTVEPVRWAKIASIQTGRIVAYPAREGQIVQAGEVLVQLDDGAARAQVQELEARLAFLERDLQRYTKLVKGDTVSRQAYERAQSELDQALATLAAARQRVTDLTMLAPLDGRVLRKDREVGEVVQAGDVLLWVGQDPPYWITAEIDEEDIPRVEPEQRALITADAFPGQALEGRVAGITPMGDPIDKSYRVRVVLPKDSPLMIGMTTEVNIVARADENALLIPETALVDGAVWVVTDDTARRRPVETGVFGNSLVEVRQGLAGDERVIDRPPAGLTDGTPVRIRKGTP